MEREPTRGVLPRAQVSKPACAHGIGAARPGGSSPGGFLRASHPENLYALAQALERAGEADAARRAYRDFEERAGVESERADNYNRELVLYLVDRAERPEEALRIAERERRRRGDVLTRDAHAWALHASGQGESARAEIEAALAPGIRDPTLSYHAGMIALGLGDAAAAADHLHRAAVPGAPPELAESARALRAALAEAGRAGSGPPSDVLAEVARSTDDPDAEADWSGGRR